MAIRRKGQREFESDLKKKMITDTAISMFRYRGYENTTIADISKATRMSVGSIYNFFGSKEGILTAAVKELGRHLIYTDTTLAEKITDPRNAVKELLFAYSDFFLSFGPELSKYMGNAMYSIYNDKTGYFVETESVKNLTEFIRACQEAQTMKNNRSPEENAQIILTVFQGIVMQWTRFQFDLKERLGFYIDIILNDMIP